MNWSRLLIVMLLVGLAGHVRAQKYTVRGQVLDTMRAPLSGATVLLLNPADSSLVNFSSTDNAGTFILKNVRPGDHLVKVTYVGYQPAQRRITAQGENFTLDLEPFHMAVETRQLDEVVVKGEVPPVVIKKDTIEYNAGSFKVQTNGNVEDLLKKLPGVEVDNDGTITAQGEQVQRVTVDGKTFFGSDPKIATRNLPADAIDKVQVFDKRSDQATFTGIDDGEREKTINLELKEEKRKGAFGNLSAGAGMDDRFMLKASINKFSKLRQLSFLGLGNNINEQGFSIDDYLNFTGGSQSMMAGGGMRLQFSSEGSNEGVPLNLGGNRANGIMTSYAAGANINNDFNKNTTVNASYFFNYLEHDREKSTYRENFLPAGSFVYTDQSLQQNSNENHRVNMTLDHKIDSANSIKFTTSFQLSDTQAKTTSSSESTSPENALKNTSESQNYTLSNRLSSNSSLLLRHRFAKKGRTLSANLTLGLQQQDQSGSLYSVNNYFTPEPEEQIIHQNNEQTTDNLNYSGTLAYTEPLGGRKYLEARYSYRKNASEVLREVYDVEGDQEIPNDILSNEYSSDYTYNKAGVNFKLNRTKYNVTAGAAYQNTRLTGDLVSQATTIDRSFETVLPAVQFNYDFSNTKHLRFEYQTVFQEPNIQQLQPVVDNSDPLNVYVGNPDLQPAYLHDWSVNFMTFDPASFVSFLIAAEFNLTNNAIVSARSTNEQLRSVTQPINVPYSASSRTDVNVSFPITPIKSRFSLGGNASTTRSSTVLNDQSNRIDQRTVVANARLDFTHQENLTFGLSARLGHQVTEYEFDQPDQSYLNQSYTAEGYYSMLKKYNFNASFEYLVYNSKSTDFHQSMPLLNASVSRMVLRNNAGEIKLSVNNLLDQALGVTQAANINYLERVTTQSLGRYVMLSFTYALNKQLNPMGMRPGGRMMRVIRE